MGVLHLAGVGLFICTLSVDKTLIVSYDNISRITIITIMKIITDSDMVLWVIGINPGPSYLPEGGDQNNMP